jgi:hypothetical protein
MSTTAFTATAVAAGSTSATTSRMYPWLVRGFFGGLGLAVAGAGGVTQGQAPCNLTRNLVVVDLDDVKHRHIPREVFFAADRVRRFLIRSPPLLASSWQTDDRRSRRRSAGAVLAADRPGLADGRLPFPHFDRHASAGVKRPVSTKPRVIPPQPTRSGRSRPVTAPLRRSAPVSQTGAGLMLAGTGRSKGHYASARGALTCRACARAECGDQAHAALVRCVPPTTLPARHAERHGRRGASQASSGFGFGHHSPPL